MTGTVETHIKDIKAGDIVFHRGDARTVTAKDIGGDSFWGVTIFGDSYNFGHRPVLKIPHFGKWLAARQAS